MFQWTVTQGMVLNPSNRDESTRDPMAALDFVMHSRDQAVFVFKDFHPFLNDVALVRRLRDLTYALKTSYKTLIILSPLLEAAAGAGEGDHGRRLRAAALEDLDQLLDSDHRVRQGQPAGQRPRLTDGGARADLEGGAGPDRDRGGERLRQVAGRKAAVSTST